MDSTETPKPPETPPEKQLPQSEVNRIVAKEVAAARREAERITAEHAALTERLAKYESERTVEAEAKMSAEKRAEAQHARELAKIAAERDTHATLATATRARLHETMLGHEASRRIAPLTAKLFNPSLASDVTDLVARALRVGQDSKGGDIIEIRTGDDYEPLTDAAWTAFAERRLTSYYAAQGGSGVPHGAGNGTSQTRLTGLRGPSLYEAALKKQ